MPVAVYGASGRTGRMVLAELERDGTETVAAGRDADLAELLRDSDVVVNCAPALTTGEPLLRAAISAGCHYADAAGEQAFIRRLFESYGAEAERRGVTVAPALGFDYAPGDCIARLVAREREPLRELVIAYALSGTGVGRDALEGAAGHDAGGGGEVVFESGAWRPAPRGVRRASFRFPEPLGRQPMQRYGCGEAVTVPRHTSTRGVTTLITAGSWAPHPRLVGAMPYMRPLAAAVRRSPLRRLLGVSARRGADPAASEARDRSTARFVIAAVARGEDGSVGRGLVEGADFYGLTGRCLALGAARLAAGESPAGVQPPAAALDPERFLDALGDRGVRWRVE